MKLEDFEKIIKPIYLLDAKHRNFIEPALISNFNKWNEEKQIVDIVEDVSHIKNDSLEQKIYVTNSSPNNIYAAFDSENRCSIESEESGCYMTEITLYKGERL